jgi:eukaryotic-like serine/threonine-protein kinase
MRLKVVGASIPVVLFVFLFCLPSLGEDPWMFRGNPSHSGIYEGAGVPRFSSVKWKFHTGGMLIGSPAIANGKVFFGSTDGNLYAVNGESGAQQWKFETKSRIPSTPAVADGTVYFGAYDGIFYAVDASNGMVKWKFQTGGERRFAGKHLHGVQPVSETMPDPFDCYLSSPVVWNGAVYFGSGDGNVYSLNAASGAVNWKFKTGDVVHASPAIADGVLFIGSWDSYFYALDASTGQEKWRFKTGEDPETHNQVGIQSSAAVADGIVYFGCRDSHLYALDAVTGQKKWAFGTDGSWVVSSPAVKGGKVYFVTSDSSLLYALDGKSGTVLHSVGLNHWYLYSSPAIAGTMIYVGSTQGKLIAIDLGEFKPAWTFATDGMKKNGPAYTKPDGTPNNEAIYVSDFYDDMVAGVDRVMSMGAVITSPVISGNAVYVGSADWNLYALK